MRNVSVLRARELRVALRLAEAQPFENAARSVIADEMSRREIFETHALKGMLHRRPCGLAAIALAPMGFREPIPDFPRFDADDAGENLVTRDREARDRRPGLARIGEEPCRICRTIG